MKRQASGAEKSIGMPADGLRGGGEGGTTPALGAVVNAIVDALAELGVEHLEMPATPERVWQAIRTARGVPHPGTLRSPTLPDHGEGKKEIG